RDSLKRLGVDHLDLYFLHWPDDQIPLQESWGAMAELADQGLVRAIGLSNYTLAQIEACHASTTPRTGTRSPPAAGRASPALSMSRWQAACWRAPTRAPRTCARSGA